MLVMRDALLSQLQKDRLRQEIIVAELAKIGRAMALRAATGGQQATPTAAGECLTTCDGKVARQNAASDEQRLPGSNEVRALSILYSLHMSSVLSRYIIGCCLQS